jgi:hypothetical protein
METFGSRLHFRRPFFDLVSGRLVPLEVSMNDSPSIRELWQRLARLDPERFPFRMTALLHKALFTEEPLGHYEREVLGYVVDVLIDRIDLDSDEIVRE